LRRLAPYLLEYRWRVLAALVFMVGAKQANVGVPVILKEMVDAMTPRLDPAALPLLVPAGLLLAYGLLRLSTSLFTELREERGLCYQIGSETCLFHETGALQVIAGLDPDSRAESLETILRETADLATRGPRPGELERAKRLAIAQSKLAFESTSAHAAWAGEGLLFYNHIPSPAEARENLLVVTDSQIQSIAQQIFSQTPATAEIRA
jgi:predicted Zn-dependent peptidase